MAVDADTAGQLSESADTIAGAAAPNGLHRRGFEVTCLEAASYIGGCTSTASDSYAFASVKDPEGR